MDVDGEEDVSGRTEKQAPKQPKSMNFFRKFAELQLLMLQHNAGLTASHPYASGPINWPFVLNGISFWTEADSQKQIYLAGNVIGWWTCTVGLSIFVGVLGADLIARRREMDPIPDRMYLFYAIGTGLTTYSIAVRNRLWNNAGFFFLVWGVHYAPFFLMSRQLFIHHYLPSHLASALVVGAVLNFVLSETINYPISIADGSTRRRPQEFSDIGLKGPVVVVIYSLVLFSMFLFLSPLTYGTPG